LTASSASGLKFIQVVINTRFGANLMIFMDKTVNNIFITNKFKKNGMVRKMLC
jgi:predicted acetyltransferase